MQLDTSGKSATSQHATLCCLKQGLNYRTLSLDPVDMSRAKRCLTLISNWLSALGKEARRAKRAHLEDLSSAGSSSVATMSAIENFATSREMVDTLNVTVSRIKKSECEPEPATNRNDMACRVPRILIRNFSAPSL